MSEIDIPRRFVDTGGAKQEALKPLAPPIIEPITPTPDKPSLDEQMGVRGLKIETKATSPAARAYATRQAILNGGEYQDPEGTIGFMEDGSPYTSDNVKNWPSKKS